MKHKLKAGDAGTITTIDGKTTITLEEFDRRAEDGEALDEFFDYSKARRGVNTLKPGDKVTMRQVDYASGRLLSERTYTHGGARPGSGRKVLGRQGRTVRLSAKAWHNLEARAARDGLNISQVIERLAA